MSYLTLLPAYGRDYGSKAAVMADWDANKDFVEAESAKYINRTDVLSYSPQSTVYIRYAKLRKVVVISPKKSKSS